MLRAGLLLAAGAGLLPRVEPRKVAQAVARAVDPCSSSGRAAVAALEEASATATATLSQIQAPPAAAEEAAGGGDKGPYAEACAGLSASLHKLQETLEVRAAAAAAGSLPAAFPESEQRLVVEALCPIFSSLAGVLMAASSAASYGGSTSAARQTKAAGTGRAAAAASATVAAPVKARDDDVSQSDKVSSPAAAGTLPRLISFSLLIRPSLLPRVPLSDPRLILGVKSPQAAFLPTSRGRPQPRRQAAEVLWMVYSECTSRESRSQLVYLQTS